MENSSVNIRPFREEDLPFISDIAVRAWTPIFESRRERMGEEKYQAVCSPGAEAKRGFLARFSCESPGQIIVACDSMGRIIGFACYRLNETRKTGIISDNAVDKSCGLKGVGQAMYTELFRRFREAGMTMAEVETGLDEAHAPARRAYERAGFEAAFETVCYFRKL